MLCTCWLHVLTGSAWIFDTLLRAANPINISFRRKLLNNLICELCAHLVSVSKSFGNWIFMVIYRLFMHVVCLWMRYSRFNQCIITLVCQCFCEMCTFPIKLNSWKTNLRYSLWPVGVCSNIKHCIIKTFAGIYEKLMTWSGFVRLVDCLMGISNIWRYNCVWFI